MLCLDILNNMTGESLKISPKEKEDLIKVFKEILDNLKSRFKDAKSLQQVLVEGAHFTSSHTKERQEPEEFTKRNIIEPLFEFLGYVTIPETRLPTPEGLKKPDYIISPPDGKPIIYVEAEPINQKLYEKRHGVDQVQSWLISRAAETEYGIATNGFEWILLKFDEVNVKVKPILSVNIQDIFKKLLNPLVFIEDEIIEEAKEKFLIFHKDHILQFINEYSIKLEEEKEEISKKFYNDYVKYVFGLNERGKPVGGINLLDSIIPPSGMTDHDKKLFAVILMNRLLFIKFLEEKGIVERDLLSKLYERYKTSGPIESFYKVYLMPLFYYVFNKSPANRPSTVKENDFYKNIPYLNGGLFREILPMEKEYDVSNEGIELIISQLLEKYSFGLGTDSKINPDILGYVFEKTINYISRTGTNEQKMKGAYYTPDDVVGFIIKNTLEPVIYEKMIKAMREMGWKEPDLAQIKAIDDVLRYLTSKNAPTIEKILEKINEIKVLDPAVGSGHFLTAALSTILRVKISLLHLITPEEEEIDRYHLKKEIIAHNLFGVDIDEHAVEIARLRLWLSLIEDVSNVEHIDTLPNVDYNVVSGDSLIGMLNDDLTIHPLINLLEDEYVKGTLDTLGVFYPTHINAVKELLEKRTIVSVLAAYEELKGIYVIESGERAVKMRGIIEKIRDKLYEVINGAYIAYLSELSKRKKKKLKSEKLTNLSHKKLFHWNVDFGDVLKNGGFDAVVGNPPYGRLKEIVKDKDEKKFLSKLYGTIYEHQIGNYNLYKLFLERTYHLVKKGGYFGMIFPSSFLGENDSKNLRKLFFENMRVLRILEFPEKTRVFIGITQAVNIFIYHKEKVEDDYEFMIKTSISKEKRERLDELEYLRIRRSELRELSSEDYRIPLFCDPTIEWEILRYLSRFPPFKGNDEVPAVGVMGEGHLHETQNKEFMSDEPGDDLLVKGIHLDRYFVNLDPNGPKPRWVRDKERFFALKPTARDVVNRTPKVIGKEVQNMGLKLRLNFTVLYGPYVMTNTIRYILVEDSSISTEFLTTILNSKLLNWRFKLFSVTNHIKKYEVEMLPISRIHQDEQSPYIKIAKYLMFLKQYKNYFDPNNEKLEEMIRFFEDLIDCLVYELYFGDVIGKGLKDYVDSHAKNVDLQTNLLDSTDNERQEILEKIEKIYESLRNDANITYSVYCKKEHPWIRAIERSIEGCE